MDELRYVAAVELYHRTTHLRGLFIWNLECGCTDFFSLLPPSVTLNICSISGYENEDWFIPFPVLKEEEKSSPLSPEQVEATLAYFGEYRSGSAFQGPLHVGKWNSSSFIWRSAAFTTA